MTEHEMLTGRQCPPCTGDCNQGRECPARTRAANPRIDWMMIAAVVCVLSRDTLCWLKAMFPPLTRRQPEPRRRWLHFMPAEDGGFMLGAMVGVALGLGAGVIAWLVLA